MLLENQVFRERVRIAQELGLEAEDMRKLLARSVDEPLHGIDGIDLQVEIMPWGA